MMKKYPPITTEILNRWLTKFLNGFSCWSLRIYCRIRYNYKVVGGKNYQQAALFKSSGGFILASNHQAFLDIPLLVASLPARYFAAFMAKQELFSKPLGNWFFSNSGTISVNRTQLEKSTIKACKEALETPNWVMAIFPEGTRDGDGSVSSVKGGTTFISKLCKAPILPAGIAIANKGKGFRPKVFVVIKPPIYLEPDETMEAYTARFQQVLQEAREEAYTLL
jgi:1-acyl-sn-glycerol-3-phosphate acyltransferase